jgi:cyclopropane fatty-acyl-phospholipid synthase-like methyltransferase
MDPNVFESLYQGQAPWDIAGPQPALVALAEAGEIVGRVLDAGCGTGENALYLAARGHEVWGIDFLPVAIERARKKSEARGLDVRFQVANALELGRLGCDRSYFDTVIDCGLFHTFSDEERTVYAAGLAPLLRTGGRLHVMCFSDREPPGEGPRRVSQEEIRHCFQRGWHVEQIRESVFETLDSPGAPRFSPGGPKAWLATVTRTQG